MAERNQKYHEMVDSIAGHINALIADDQDDALGTAVLISTPVKRDLTVGDVKGWVCASMMEKNQKHELLLMAFYTLCHVLLSKFNVDPQILHQLVMANAVRNGKAIVINLDENGDEDIPQA